MQNFNQIKNRTGDYAFLNNERLGDNLIFLTLGGSYAYGTNVETSDIDVRGIVLNSKSEILLGRDFGVFTDNKTDTTVYSLNKIIQLLSNCNPNVIEMFGNQETLFKSEIGQMLFDNRDLFLSQKCVNSFGGYANQQLWRLNNKAVRKVSDTEREGHILKSMQHAFCSFGERYADTAGGIQLYLDDASEMAPNSLEQEIFIDCNLNHYPVRDYLGMMRELQTIVKEYNKIGSRNSKAASKQKLGKHMMHLVRLYLMCFDLLEMGQIVTYRPEPERATLLSIRNGAYLDANDRPIPEFFDWVSGLEKRLEYDKNNTALPKEPDYKRIQELQMAINELVVRRD